MYAFIYVGNVSHFPKLYINSRDPSKGMNIIETAGLPVTTPLTYTERGLLYIRGECKSFSKLHLNCRDPSQGMNIIETAHQLATMPTDIGNTPNTYIIIYSTLLVSMSTENNVQIMKYP